MRRRSPARSNRTSCSSKRASGIVFAVVSAAAQACTSESSGDVVPVRLKVFAASSLTEAFRDVEALFEAAHPEVDVVLSFAGSQTLRLQIERGARADVFASADPAQMELLSGAGLVEDERPFAYNAMAVIVPPGNPAGIESFRDLPRAERLVVGTENVPAGAYARRILAAGGEFFGPGFREAVKERIVSEESNIRLVRAKVERGEADAAIVYRTDALGARVRVVPVPANLNVEAEYVVAVVSGRTNRSTASRWIDFLGSVEAQDALAGRGFVVSNRPSSR